MLVAKYHPTWTICSRHSVVHQNSVIHGRLHANFLLNFLAYLHYSTVSSSNLNPHYLFHMCSKRRLTEPTFSLRTKSPSVDVWWPPDMHCVSLYMLTFVKTHFISTQTFNICCIIFKLRRNEFWHISKDVDLTNSKTPITTEKELLLVNLVS